MGKVIKNPKEVKLVEVDGGMEISLHYGLSSEEYPDIATRKGLAIDNQTLTSQEQSVVDQIMTWATSKMKAHEGIAE